jgi:LysR family glycine cleavage system transcriptional activator
MPRVASAWLVPRLPSFVAAHPDIELNIQSSTDLVDFERDVGIDVAIRFGRGQWPGTEAVHLFDEWIKPVAAPQLAKKLGA